MRTQADLAIGRELERKDAEIARLKADLATFGKDTEATENRIIDAEFKAQELLVILQELVGAELAVDATIHDRGANDEAINRLIAARNAALVALHDQQQPSGK